MTSHPEICEIFFVRHAPVVKQRNHVPPHDPPIEPHQFNLTPLVSQLPKAADWHVSPLRRAQQTAQLLTPALAPATMSDAQHLVEMDFGIWHDRPVAEIWDQIKDGPLHNWAFLSAELTAPKGESFAALTERVAEWMREVEAAFTPTPQIVVTHAGVMRAAMALALAAPLDHVVGVPVPHFGVLKLTLMDPERATAAGGAWLFGGLTDPGIS